MLLRQNLCGVYLQSVRRYIQIMGLLLNTRVVIAFLVDRKNCISGKVDADSCWWEAGQYLHKSIPLKEARFQCAIL